MGRGDLFPVMCRCPAGRRQCAQNTTDCQLPWVVDERERVRPSVVERIVGWLADLLGQ
jgi:hypothetical protein